MKRKYTEWPKLCSIVNQYHRPKTVVIYTLRFKGETEEYIKKKLDKALATIPFFTIYSYIIFGGNSDWIKEAVVTKVIDYPGAETIHMSLDISKKENYFLPRNPVTGEFTDIAKQVKCLEVLRGGV